jgi:hypothetical protein
VTLPRALTRLTPVLLTLTVAGCGGSSTTSSSTQATAGKAQTATQSTTQSTPTSTAPGTVAASSGALTAVLHAGTHQPKVEAPWPIRMTATQNGSPAKATVIYEYLFAGQVVAHRSHYTFTGHFSDILKWPASAVGYQLTFRAVVNSGGVTVNLDYPVQVAR